METSKYRPLPVLTRLTYSERLKPKKKDVETPSRNLDATDPRPKDAWLFALRESRVNAARRALEKDLVAALLKNEKRAYYLDMEEITQCCICRRQVSDSFFNSNTQIARIVCPRCGRFSIAGDLSLEIGTARLTNFYKYAGAIRELNERGVDPMIDNLETLLSSVRVPRNPIEMMDRILVSLQNTLSKAGDSRTFDENDYSIGYAQDYIEFSYLIRKMKESGLLFNAGAGGMDCQIETAGWRRLMELAEFRAKPDQAFVAMRFHEDLTEAYDNGIYVALKETGYEPFRIDRKEHNDRIDDRIIAEIRKSGLIVADFTMYSPGVYFEAGLALGLGIPLIWSCREDENKGLHFDTQQFNHIMWKDVADLKEQLINRINATAPSPTNNA